MTKTLELKEGTKKVLGIGFPFPEETSKLRLKSKGKRLFVGPCSGVRVIRKNPKKSIDKVFEVVSDDFILYQATEPGPDTPLTEVAIYEPTVDDSFVGWLESFEIDLGRLMMTASMAIAFAQKYKKFWLNNPKIGTLVPYTSYENFFAVEILKPKRMAMRANLEKACDEKILKASDYHLVVPEYAFFK